MLRNNPKVFRLVCPALRWSEQQQEWRCSLDRDKVRPFWGRALCYYCAAGLALYLALILVAFGGMRATGMELSYADIAWPPGWRHFNEIRARHYFQKGQAALAANRFAEANLALPLAYELDPTRYETGFLLAQWREAGQGGLSDQVFRQLLASHPERAGETSRAWGRALLRRGEFPQLVRLARNRLQLERDATTWLHALIFPARMLDDAAPLATGAALPGLSNEMRALMQLEMRALSGDGADTLRPADRGCQRLCAILPDQFSKRPRPGGAGA